MKEKIAQALKTEYASFGLSQKALDGVASLIEKTVTDESMIDAAIKEAHIKEFLKSMQSDADTLRNAKSKAEKDLADYKAKHPEKVEPTPDPDDPVKAEIAELKAKFEASEAARVAAEKASRKKDLLAEASRLMKEKGSDNDFILKMTLKDAVVEDTDTAESLAEKYKSAYDSNYTEAYGNGNVPPTGKPIVTEYKDGAYAGMVERFKASGKIPVKNQD